MIIFIYLFLFLQIYLALIYLFGIVGMEFFGQLDDYYVIFKMQQAVNFEKCLASCLCESAINKLLSDLFARVLKLP